METMAVKPMPDPAFWSGRRVLVTGHTGFKGAWLSLLLDHLGSHVSGLALDPAPGGAFAAMRPPMTGDVADIRDCNKVADVVRRTRPEIVLHLAAQSLVGEGHARPLETFATNVMGTANLLEALRDTPAAVALVVTSDKVYRMGIDAKPFHEASPLGGADPYSASKAAAEHVAACWRERLRDAGCRVATARAGNVLGGGDTGAGRLAPDVIRARHAGERPILRRPESIRPWQYVLDVLSGYLSQAQMLWTGDAPPALNFGPDPNAAITAAELAERLLRAFGASTEWRRGDGAFAETPVLRLDSSLAARTLGWRATTNIERAVAWTAAWHEASWRGEDMRRVGSRQIDAWLNA
jgi:CDP-glucose 4,6-dehydratase